MDPGTVTAHADSVIVLAAIAGALLVGGGLWASRRRRTPTTTKTSSGVAAGGQGSVHAGLGRTRSEGFVARIASLLGGRRIDDALLGELEEVLLTADIGVATANRLLEAVRTRVSGSGGGDPDQVWGALRAEAKAILEAASDANVSPPPETGTPHVVMVLGVNGSGKTTTIGKLAHQLVGAGKKVHLVAGDTFRAAAAEQLEIWARRVGAEMTRGSEGADPASVAFDGVRRAAEDGCDVVLTDTAGRLHTQVNLMEELKKVKRVMGKALPGAPQEVLLVLDATTGQNAIQQARIFHEATGVTGIVLTKVDGTAKGGVVIGVCEEVGVPIRYLGVGERVDDLRPFDPSAFVDALFAPTGVDA